MVTLSEADKREIGQHFVFGFYGHEIGEDVKTLIRDYHVGNIILMKRNVQSVKQVHGLVRSLQQFAKECGHTQPLMIGIDQENGLVSAFTSTTKYTAGTQFPGAMALAATGQPEIARACSAASAKEMKLAGINWAYSPVADVNSDHRNPVIGVRSFGDNPNEVAKYAQAVSAGLTSEGIAPSAKHFPGHGDTHVDSHLALPVINKTKDQLDQTELVPFLELVKSKVATIMTGHMALPLVVKEADKQTPCSCSRSITTDLLRGEMGFTGVIVTDCLEMDAVAAKYTSQKGAVLCLQAGADIVMICHTMDWQRGAVEETYKAIENGSLSLEELKASGRRVSELKTQFAGTWDSVLAGFNERALSEVVATNKEISASSYASSTALIRGALPDLRKSPGPVLLLIPQTESLNKAVDDAEGVLRTNSGQVRNTAGPHYIAFANTVSTYREGSQLIVYSRLSTTNGEVAPEVLETIRSKDTPLAAVIFVTRNADNSTWQLEYLRKLQENNSKTPIIILASCAPYDLMNVPDLEYPCLATFEYTPAALKAAGAVIFGEAEAKGQVPVKIVEA
ncbi:glycoside hydrolase family 3 protein [Hydnomerulius pinastri MD-312]|uniref:Glycoside hydrolase family 3 protein n=1 Tax=Hydnomerulius pinastri MD-312 TaxID=994086 RepID=A0A0C9W2Z2_9AGAM|nr:glycoside hydrolase family 3 protein [Hydnomerulius pinastri MD-312]